MLLAAFTLRYHVLGAGLLLRFSAPEQHNFLTGFRRHLFREEPATFAAADGTPVRARLYTPDGVSAPPALVLVPGVHYRGMAEPRLMRLARALAAGGVQVLTPELPNIADYSITARSAEVIGEAAAHLAQNTGSPVGVVGLSFSGGLALIAAADDRYSPHIAFVGAIGAHYSLQHVLRFYATNRFTWPDGRSDSLAAHEYGALIIIYTYARDFFPPADAETARTALRLWLYEQPEKATALLARVSPRSRQRLETLFSHKRDFLRAELLAAVERHAQDFALASPQGRLHRIRVPVLLLHGSGDDVIPPGETAWLAHELPPERRRNVLISPVLSHVNLQAEQDVRHRWRLVDFMADLLHEAHLTRNARRR